MIDIEPPTTTSPDDASVNGLVSIIQHTLAAAAARLAPAGLVLAGPDVIAANDAAGISILRLGVWLVDTDIARARAGNPDVESITVTLTEPNIATTAVHGSHLGIGFSIDITETLAVAPLTGRDPPQSVPHIEAHHSTSVGDLLDWLHGALIPILGGVLLYGDNQLASDAEHMPGRRSTCSLVGRQRGTVSLAELLALDTADRFRTRLRIMLDPAGHPFCLFVDGEWRRRLASPTGTVVPSRRQRAQRARTDHIKA